MPDIRPAHYPTVSVHRFLLCQTTHAVNARIADDWQKLRNEAHSTGVDSLRAQPDPGLSDALFRPDRPWPNAPPDELPGFAGARRYGSNQPAYSPVAGPCLAGADWCLLLDSLKLQDRHYRQLTACCIPCLINARQAFTQENRQLSHGCIRVGKPGQLVNLLLGYVRFNADYLTCCPQNASPKTIPLPAAVPVVTTYNVLDMDEAGAVQVCRDVYG